MEFLNEILRDTLMKAVSSLRRKILINVGGTVSILLLICAFFLIQVIASQSRVRVDLDVRTLMKSEAESVKSYFTQYAAIAQIYLKAPQFQAWFQQQNIRGKDYHASPGYQAINATFVKISEQDPNILSAFFASALTGEYFRENEITGEPTPDTPNASPYDARTRAWYQEATQYTHPTLAPPSPDLTTGIISSALMLPVKDRYGKLIGIGGLDLDLNQIGQRIDRIQYQGYGYTILVDQHQNIVHFPQEIGVQLAEKHGQLNQLIHTKGMAGFEKLNFDQISKGENISTQSPTVSINDIPYQVFTQRLQQEFPEMNWQLVFLLPQSVIHEPVWDATWAAILTSFTIVIALLSVMTLGTRKVTRPIHHLRAAMRNVAQGEGDLTQSIDIHSRDEVGALAEYFNQFVQKLRQVLIHVAEQSHKVTSSSGTLDQLSTATSREIQDQKTQLESVTTAVAEMTSTVQEISLNAHQASHAADDAESQTQSGFVRSENAMQQMIQLEDSMAQAAKVVAGLEKESENIGAVVDVINTIADQTNLLALNAAIEAARAGEQGRGFAVVAGEVRELASRTQESTNDIRQMIEQLRCISKEASEVMLEGQTLTHEGVQLTQNVQSSLQAINAAITTVKEQNHQIAVATEQQSVVAESINESLHAIQDHVENTTQRSRALETESKKMHETSHELHALLMQFKT